MSWVVKNANRFGLQPSNSQVEWGSHFKLLQSFLAKKSHFADIQPKRRNKERNSCYFEIQPRDTYFSYTMNEARASKKSPSQN